MLVVGRDDLGEAPAAGEGAPRGALPHGLGVLSSLWSQLNSISQWKRICYKEMEVGLRKEKARQQPAWVSLVF